MIFSQLKDCAEELRKMATARIAVKNNFGAMRMLRAAMMLDECVQDLKAEGLSGMDASGDTQAVERNAGAGDGQG
jgi:hypothetical protein